MEDARTPPANKDAKMVAVAEATAKLVVLHGIEGVTYAKVARASSVSRPWLYKYIGRERADLVRFVADHFGAELADLGVRPRTDSAEHWIADSVAGVELMLASAQRAPWVLPLYFRYVGTDTPLGDCVQRVEQRYLSVATGELQRAMGLPEEHAAWTAELFHAARMGIVHRQLISGFCPPAETQLLRRQLERWLRSFA